jgi:aryl-alcohol dehydrogenase-like predicted oxidoreductase
MGKANCGKIVAAKLRAWTSVSAIQIEDSLVERTSETDLLPMAWRHGIMPTAWSPLGGGVLSGKYSQADLQSDVTGENCGAMLKVMGQLNDRTLAGLYP